MSPCSHNGIIRLLQQSYAVIWKIVDVASCCTDVATSDHRSLQRTMTERWVYSTLQFDVTTLPRCNVPWCFTIRESYCDRLRVLCALRAVIQTPLRTRASFTCASMCINGHQVSACKCPVSVASASDTRDLKGIYDRKMHGDIHIPDDAILCNNLYIWRIKFQY